MAQITPARRALLACTSPAPMGCRPRAGIGDADCEHLCLTYVPSRASGRAGRAPRSAVEAPARRREARGTYRRRGAEMTENPTHNQAVVLPAAEEHRL